MALVINSSYAGEAAAGFISAALLEANTIAQGGVQVMPNVKYKEHIQTLATANLLQDESCDFTNVGDVTIGERVLEPKALQVNLELCTTPFRQTWDAAQMGYSAFDTLPKDFATYLIAHTVAQVAEANEVSLWHGTKATAGQYDGICTRLAADTDFNVTSRNITGQAITTDNVITEMGLVVDQIPKSVYTKESLKLYVSINVYKKYKAALGGFGVAGNTSNGYRAEGQNQRIDINYYNGVAIFVANGLNDNVMVATTSDNLYFATGLLNDSNEVRTIDMAATEGSKNVRMVMRMTADTNYGFQSDIVAYGLGL